MKIITPLIEDNLFSVTFAVMTNEVIAKTRLHVWSKISQVVVETIENQIISPLLDYENQKRLDNEISI